ncbi:unnamed protein product [Cyclocybe aegerita]|uniref:Uncharacterized protein n=1 Tax=Cyclocybe aegerita TaxID=1973307 RepID=A0A8S0WWR7_CYCAE|nr:unnamed protein product [Cyclocybe aegerita]
MGENLNASNISSSSSHPAPRVLGIPIWLLDDVAYPVLVYLTGGATMSRTSAQITGAPALARLYLGPKMPPSYRYAREADNTPQPIAKRHFATLWLPVMGYVMVVALRQIAENHQLLRTSLLHLEPGNHGKSESRRIETFGVRDYDTNNNTSSNPITFVEAGDVSSG